MIESCKRSLVEIVLFLVVVDGIQAVHAQQQSLKPGINDGYKQTDIDRSIQRFEDPKRDVVRKLDEIVAACGLEPGMTVADVGAGTGLFTRPMAAKVVPGGKVYAVDITEAFVEHVTKTCKERGIENVVGIVSTETSAKLPPNSTDLAFLCDTYHHFEYPYKMLDSIREALRPEGRLVIIDRKRADGHARADQEAVKKEIVAAGFAFLDERDISDREYLMRFKRAERPAGAPQAAESSPGGGAGVPGQQQPAKLNRPLQVTLDYLLFLPQDYDKKDAWPLMLFLHGAGERGNNLELVKKHGPPKIVESKRDFPFILVSPQCPANRWWQPMELAALLDEIAAKYKVDPDRIYVTGLSMGGFGTWALAAYCPERLAAIVPICGGGEAYWAEKYVHLPVWVFHGAKDKAVPAERSQQMVDALKKHGGSVKCTIYPEAGHDAWTETYENPELYQWLLEQKRSGPESDKTKKAPSGSGGASMLPIGTASRDV